MASVRAQTGRAAAMVAGMILLDYALARANVRYRPGVSGALIVTALATKGGLASVWAVIGRDSVLGRLMVLLTALSGTWVFLRQWYRVAESEMVPAFCIQAVVVVTVLLVMRAFRFRTVYTGGAAAHAPTDRRPRFSIRDILILTVLIGVALAVVTRMQTLSVQSEVQTVSCVIGAIMACITLAAVYSALVFRQAVLPLVLLAGGSLVLGWGIGTALRYDTAATTVLIGAQTLLQISVFAAARIAGYRFTRSPAGAGR